MIDQERNQTAAKSKALRLRLWMRTDQMSDADYAVPCMSRRHWGHVVTHLGPNKWRCTCEAAEFGAHCAHIDAAVHARAYYEATSPKRPAARSADSAILGARTSELRRSMAEDPDSIDLYASIQPMAAGR